MAFAWRPHGVYGYVTASLPRPHGASTASALRQNRISYIPLPRAVNVQSLQPEIALRNYQNTAHSSWHVSNSFQKDNDLTPVPHKVLFHDAWCNSCNVFVSLYDSKNRPLSPSNSNELLIHDFLRIGVGKCTKKRFISNKIIKYLKQHIS